MADTDRDPTRPSASPDDDIALRLSRASAAQQRQAQADLNDRPPAPQYDAVTGRRFYDTAPRPLRRLLGSPLAQSGKYARGPHSERLIGGGWGDPRNFSYDPRSPSTSRHQGLDYLGPLGEALLATGDGTVTFVGFQSKRGATAVVSPRMDAQGNVLDDKGAIVAIPSEIGFGGIAVHVAHNGDFQGYRTEYYHMDAATAVVGQRVLEGQVLGTLGRSGVPGLGPHLHLQIAYVAGKTSALVNPTSLVPNYWPGHMDSTNSDGARGVALPPLAVAGSQVASSRAAGIVSAIDRATTLQNQGVADVRRAQSEHAGRIAQVIGVQQSALYAATAGFQGKSPVVSTPMAFDFQIGTWTDGKAT